MSLQVINSTNGQAEYVLLPIRAYELLKPQIEKIISDDYEPFILEDYVSNPVALARIAADLTQEELAKAMEVSQAYISKVESQKNVSAKTLVKVKAACADYKVKF